MEVTNTRYKHCDLLKVVGKVDSYTAPDLTKAIEALNQRKPLTKSLSISANLNICPAQVSVLCLSGSGIASVSIVARLFWPWFRRESWMP